MRLIVQRVKKANVSVNGELVSEIGHGLFVLLGVGLEDTKEEAERLALKLSKLRVMKDENEKMNLTVKDVNGEFLIVSQFTLYADTKGGNRPSFVNAALPEVAKPIYEHFVKTLESYGSPVKIGSFGNYMQIQASIDGPVTIILE